MLILWFSQAWNLLSLPDNRLKTSRHLRRVDLVPWEAFF
ncbi:hypothetical protein CKA32_001229 [Geitlerinema sp. FC II]|nr:hypothetical protein CKA32_001229 [Geitlerinema sp. FC II]